MPILILNPMSKICARMNPGPCQGEVSSGHLPFLLRGLKNQIFMPREYALVWLLWSYLCFIFTLVRWSWRCAKEWSHSMPFFN